MKSIKTNAIVLRRTNYGEADRIIQAITPSGKVSFIARGVRKERSKLAGGIELFAVCEIVYGDSNGKLGTLTSSRLVKFYSHILEDYDRMQFAYDAIKHINAVSETIHEPEWYDVMQEILSALDAKSINLDIIKTWFYLKYSSLLGHEINLYIDVDNDKISQDKKYKYDIVECGLRESTNGNISADHIKLLRIISTKSLKIISQIGGVENYAIDCLQLSREHAAI